LHQHYTGVSRLASKIILIEQNFIKWTGQHSVYSVDITPDIYSTVHVYSLHTQVWWGGDNPVRLNVESPEVTTKSAQALFVAL
jgi:hypothetical protein